MLRAIHFALSSIKHDQAPTGVLTLEPITPTTPNSSDPTRSTASHYLVTPSPTGGWSMFEVLPGGEQDAAEFTAGMTDVLTFRTFDDAAEMCFRLNAY